MGDFETLAKARRELQDLYLGVPDDSVNLSFQELAQVTQRKSAVFSSQLSLHKKKSSPTPSETSSKLDKSPSLAKLPSLDFSRALEASSTHNHNPNYNINHHFDHPLRADPLLHGSSSLYHHHHHQHRDHADHHAMNKHQRGDHADHHAMNGHHHHDHADHAMNGHQHRGNVDHAMNGHQHRDHVDHAMNGHQHRGRADHVMNGHVGHHSIHYGHAREVRGDDHHHAMNGHVDHQIHHHQQHQHHHHASPYHDHSMGYVDDDMSHMSGMTMAATPYQGRRRRPGIPHSNICTLCTTYIYVFRYRCLVCGRVYCRQCVRIGMGDMAEGRKCVECLGRRFSQRYIHKAGEMGWCMGYPSSVRQQELKWAEKGPSRSGENRPGRSSMVSSSRNLATTTPSRVHRAGPGTPPPIRVHTPSTPPSFVMNSPHSPYTPTRHHPLPF